MWIQSVSNRKGNSEISTCIICELKRIYNLTSTDPCNIKDANNMDKIWMLKWYMKEKTKPWIQGDLYLLSILLNTHDRWINIDSSIIDSKKLQKIQYKISITTNIFRITCFTYITLWRVLFTEKNKATQNVPINGYWSQA